LFNGVFGKHPLNLFWIVLFQEKTGFCQTKPKKVIFFSCIWTKILKLFEHLFQKKKTNILWHVLKNIAWILQQACKIPKVFYLYFKNI
jgi:hypothetical protein